MRATRLWALLVGVNLIGFFAARSVRITGQGQTVAAPAIDNDDIGGVVTGAQGPEAGVWVIAETRTTPTRLIKIVVTDDRGRFVVPDLPSGEYDVWVRGYGLIDSAKAKTTPGKTVNLKAVPAPDKKTASRPTFEARENVFVRSSTPTAAPAAIRWADWRRAQFLKAFAARHRIPKPRGTAASSPDKPAAA